MVELNKILTEAQEHIKLVESLDFRWYPVEKRDRMTERFLKTFYPDEYERYFK